MRTQISIMLFVIAGSWAQAESHDSVKLHASFGSYNNELVREYGPESSIRQLGRPVGRLDILTDSGNFPCTAFLTHENIVITASYCVPGILEDARIKATRIEAVQLVLGYLETGNAEGSKTFTVIPEPLETNDDVGFTLLQVLGDPSAEFSSLSLSGTEIAENTPIWTIGYPMGEVQSISREACKNVPNPLQDGKIAHQCDTLGGSGGSPLIDPSTQLVIGMHYSANAVTGLNFAVSATSILENSEILKVSPPKPTMSNAGISLLQALSSTDPADLDTTLSYLAKSGESAEIRELAHSVLGDLVTDLKIEK